MNRRRKDNRTYFEIDGILPIDKPEGMTSHDVVHKIRKQFTIKKVGHGGTLDPGATGLLMLLLGKGTKASDLIMRGDKGYAGTFRLGTTTSSYDREGDVLETRPFEDVTQEAAQSAFDEWVGDVEQIPPMVSAIKKGGTPLYKLARQGKVIERDPRAVTIHRFTMESFELPDITFSMECTKGTYVRSLAHDIGETLGCGAHLYGLRRTASGDYSIEDAHQLDEILALEPEALRERVLPVPQAPAG